MWHFVLVVFLPYLKKLKWPLAVLIIFLVWFFLEAAPNISFFTSEVKQPAPEIQKDSLKKPQMPHASPKITQEEHRSSETEPEWMINDRLERIPNSVPFRRSFISAMQQEGYSEELAREILAKLEYNQLADNGKSHEGTISEVVGDNPEEYEKLYQIMINSLPPPLPGDPRAPQTPSGDSGV